MEKEDVFYVKNGEKSSTVIRIFTGIGIVVAVVILAFDVLPLTGGVKTLIFLPLFLFMMRLFIYGESSITISANGIDNYHSFFGARFGVRHLDPGEYVFELDTQRIPEGKSREKVVNYLYIRTRQGGMLLETLDLASSAPEERLLEREMSKYPGFKRVERLEDKND